MALIHSERPIGNSAEARIYDLLASSLDDEWHVWHEPEIQRTEDEEESFRPDFILLHSRRGLFVLEVKGWTLGRIKNVRKGKKGKGGHSRTVVFYEFGDGLKSVEAPFDQLDKYKREIRKQLKQRHSSLDVSAKKVNTLFDGALAFPNIRSEETASLNQDRSSILRRGILTSSRHRAVYKSRIDTWKACPNNMEADLSAVVDANLQLSPAVLKIIRGIVHPELRLAFPPSTRGALREAGDLPGIDLSEPGMLAQAQEKVARHEIGSGHRILFGVAGSGKTMILIARARWQAIRDPQRSILVLCYNRSLSLYLAKVLEEYPNIDSLTFHAWVRERVGFKLDFNTESYNEKLLKNLRKLNKIKKYDSILIDECQDWNSDWFKAVLFAAKDPVDGDLLIVGDGSQSVIYQKQLAFSWENCGIKPRDWKEKEGEGSIAFDRNYRNTPQIIAFAASFIRGSKTIWDTIKNDKLLGRTYDGSASSGEAQQDSPYEMLAPLPEPNKCARGDGPKPKLGIFADRAREMEFVATYIRHLINSIESLDSCDFAVVYPGHFSAGKAAKQFGVLLENLEMMLIPHVHVQGGIVRNQEELLAGNSVKILNVKQMKGLEQRVCFVIGVDEYWEYEEDHLLYVAMTRATDWLFLTWSGMERTDIIDRLKEDRSLYSVHEDLQPARPTAYRPDPIGDKPEIQEILKCLGEKKIRCTYTALAAYLGSKPRDIGQSLGPRRPETSWIVSARSHRPTGYSNHELDPDLFTNNTVISTETELRQLLDNNRSDQN